MNLTVGPLPPAVYWRRRALVLGGLLLVVVLVVYACSGPGTSSASADHSPSPTTGVSSGFNAPVGSASGPSVPVSPSVSVPPASPTVSPSPTVDPSPSTPPPSSGTTGIKTCTNAQIRVTPTISSTSSTTTSLIHGGTFSLKLKVRNVSDVACRRDVGGVPEELRVMQGKKLIWSSDDCVKIQGKAHDVRTFAPNIEIYAQVNWDTYDISAKGGCAKSAYPAKVGKYELVGRVGSKSATANFTIVA